MIISETVGDDMVFVRIGDGLGNQLFDYACGYAISRHNGEKLTIDTSENDNQTYRKYMLDLFNLDEHRRVSYTNRSIVHKVLNRLRKIFCYHMVYEDRKMYPGIYPCVLKKAVLRPKYLSGYWIDFVFFNMYEEDLRRQFKPGYPQSDEVKRLVDEFSSTKTCAIHFRGGDKTMLTLEYYKNAIAEVEKRTQIDKYIVFTDDYEGAKNRLSGLDIDFSVVSELGEFKDIDEFFMMIACQNQIIPDSSFSMWAAMLNENKEKVVVAPLSSKWHYPKDWIRV